MREWTKAKRRQRGADALSPLQDNHGCHRPGTLKILIQVQPPGIATIHQKTTNLLSPVHRQGVAIVAGRHEVVLEVGLVMRNVLSLAETFMVASMWLVSELRRWMERQGCGSSLPYVYITTFL